MKQQKGPDTGSREPGLAGALPEAGGSAVPSRIAKWLRRAVLLVAAAAAPSATINGCESSDEAGQEYLNLDLLNGIKYPMVGVDGINFSTDFEKPVTIKIIVFSPDGKKLLEEDHLLQAGENAVSMPFEPDAPLGSKIVISMPGSKSLKIIVKDSEIPRFPGGEGS